MIRSNEKDWPSMFRRAAVALGTIALAAASAMAEDKPMLDQPVVDDAGQLVFPSDAAIPKFMTPIEQQFMGQYLQSLRPAGGVALGGSNCCFNNGTPGCDNAACQDIICSIDPFCCATQWDQICANQANELCEVCGGGPPEGTDAPVGPVVAPPEYAPTEAIFIAWKGTTGWKTILSNMGSQITTAGDADLIVYADNQSERNAAFNSLSAAGANMSRVKFKIKPMDSIWMRDYGPRFVFEGGVRVVTDHTYTTGHARSTTRCLRITRARRGSRTTSCRFCTAAGTITCTATARGTRRT